ncbi:uncharacterized protein V6R79_006221 [Siganus canaliculatus]
MASLLTEEQFRCSICLDIFNNPVSILCGHNFCLGCIKRFWDSRNKSECPLCKEVFKPRPELRVNVGLKDITENFKRIHKHRHKPKPLRPPRMPRQPSKSDEVPCDLCQGNKIMAVKSCLVCRESYCETHLTPHLRDQLKTKHMLTDPGTFINSHLCKNHNKLLENFCKTDNMLICTKCMKDHRHHDVVPVEMESNGIKSEIQNTNTEFQQMIQTRVNKFEEIRASLQLSRSNKDRQLQASVEVFTIVINAIERNQAYLVDEIERKQEGVEIRANQHLKELREEISELQKRRGELQLLEQSDDPLHIIQSFLSLRAPAFSCNWSDVCVDSDNYIGTVRKAFSKVMEVCHNLENKMSTEEVNKMNQYAGMYRAHNNNNDTDRTCRQVWQTWSLQFN